MVSGAVVAADLLPRVRFQSSAERTVVAVKRSLYKNTIVSKSQFFLRSTPFGHNIPFKGPKNTGRNHHVTEPAAVVTAPVPRRQRDEAREPEERGDSIHGEMDNFVVRRSRQEAWGQGQIGEGGEDGPDRCEEHEGYLRGGVEVCDCCGGDDWEKGCLVAVRMMGEGRRLTPASHAEEDYGEEELEGAKDEGNEVVHCCGNGWEGLDAVVG